MSKKNTNYRILAIRLQGSKRIRWHYVESQDEVEQLKKELGPFSVLGVHAAEDILDTRIQKRLENIYNTQGKSLATWFKDNLL